MTAQPTHPGPGRTRIKICGVRTIEAAHAAVAAGADAIGLVFVAASPRCATIDEALAIVAALPPFVEPVALFADASSADIRQITAALGVRTVQLHGHETPQQVHELNDLRIIKAIDPTDQRHAPWLKAPAHEPGQLQAARHGGQVVALLLDATPTASAGEAKLTGGGGRTFDWAVIDTLDRPALPPIILAGGLKVDNVADAIARVRPFAVDVSSGVESARGVKDAGLIQAFCAAVRNADGRSR